MNASAHWDAIVIGSGLGGLSAAARFANSGKRVLVLERKFWRGGDRLSTWGTDHGSFPA